MKESGRFRFIEPSIPGFVNMEGVDTVLVEKHDTPLVSLFAAFPAGAYGVPASMAGLADFTAELMLRGASNLSRTQIDDELDALGASLSVQTGYHSAVFAAKVLRRNLDVFLELLNDVLLRPDFPPSEIDRLRQDKISGLRLQLENDAYLARAEFLRAVFPSHPYGRELPGTDSTLRAIERQDIASYFERRYRSGAMLLAAAGDLTRPDFDQIASSLIRQIPPGPASGDREPAPTRGKGRRVILVDKPERTQAHFYAGFPCLDANHPDLAALKVFVNAFGGPMFTAKLNQEIRVKRGWSYHAHAALDARRDGGCFYIYTYPSSKDAAEALRFSLDFLDEAVTGGVLSDTEIESARRHMVRSFPFALDVPDKIATSLIEARYLLRDDDYLSTWVEKISAVTPESAREAARRHLARDGFTAVVLCTAAGLADPVAEAAGVPGVEIVPYDRILGGVEDAA